MKHQPFWVDDHPRPDGLTSELPRETDVLVVGSGLTGLSAALRLANAGKDVTVIEQGDIASGASSINGGMVSPDVKAGVAGVWKTHGPGVAREMWKATVRSVELVEELAGLDRVGATVTRGGMTALGTRAGDRRRFESRVSWYRQELGAEWEVLGPDRIGEVVGMSDHFTCAFYEPEGIGVHPAELSFGLAREAVAAGAVLVDDCRASSITTSGPTTKVVTSRGTIAAGAVLMATNGYTTSRPLPELARRVVPVGSYIIVTEPLDPEEAARIFPTNSMSHTRKRLLNYMRRTPDDRILIGGRRDLRTDLDLDESAGDLRRRLVEFWPSLSDKEITHVWGGNVGVTFDLLPHIGRIDSVWYAMGYAGHGVGLSTYLGYETAGLILGEMNTSPFYGLNGESRWYYRGNPWFLTPASILHRLLDKAGL